MFILGFARLMAVRTKITLVDGGWPAAMKFDSF